MRAPEPPGCQPQAAPRLGRRLGRALLALSGCLVAGAPPGHAELIHLNLYEKPAESDLVVRGKVIRGDLPRAEVVVEEVLKGLYDRPRLEVVFRLDNFTRKAWQEKVVFHNGDPVLLFLKSFKKESGEQPYPDRFTLVRGTQGKVDLPAEGATAILEAVRRFIGVQSQTDMQQTAQDLKAFLSDPNPLVVEAGLQQVYRLRLGSPETAEVLLPILSHPVADFRRDSLLVLAQIFDDYPLRQSSLANEDHVVTLVLGRAREDEDVEVRSQAVRTLEARGKRDVLAALEQIARDDPAQQVRLLAELAALDLSRAEPASSPPAR